MYIYIYIYIHVYIYIYIYIYILCANVVFPTTPLHANISGGSSRGVKETMLQSHGGKHGSCGSFSLNFLEGA